MSKKKPNGVQLLIRMVVKSPDGKIITDTGQNPARSFVIQFLEFIGAVFDAPALLNATDVTGSERTYYGQNAQPNLLFSLDAAVNDGAFGIVIGTGDTAEDNTDYKLETQLTEGVGAGNITHGTVIFVTTAVVGANVDMIIKRTFTNNTGSTITVKEAGLYVKYYLPYYHCIVRDVLVATIDVPDKCSLTVYYTIRTTV